MPGTTPVYGFPYPLGSDPVRDGDNDIRALAEDVETVLDTQMGLVKVAAVSFTADPNPFINGCFSAAFDHYRVVLSLISSTSGTAFGFRMRYPDNSPETINAYTRLGFTFNSAGAFNNRFTSGLTSGAELGTAFNGIAYTNVAMDVYNPYRPFMTVVDSRSIGQVNGDIRVLSYEIDMPVAYAGIELLPNSGTLTGAMRVYGYRN